MLEPLNKIVHELILYLEQMRALTDVEERTFKDRLPESVRRHQI